MSANFNFDKTKKVLHTYVDEMYPLDRGQFILDPDKEIHWHNGRITRKHIKHIIEQRKDDKKSIADIKILLDLALKTILDADFELPNTNKRHPGSIMRIKILEKGGDGVVVVMDKEINGLRDVITAFIRDPQGIRKLKKKKLQESASGETPRP